MTISRLDPIVPEIITKVKDAIRSSGFCRSDEFIEFLGNTNANAEEILQHLYVDHGIDYVLLESKDGGRAEVLIDSRLVVISMFLAYAHPSFAKKHSVLEFVKAVFSDITHGGSFIFTQQPEYLEQYYRQKGHSYSVMKIAEAAEIEEDGGVATVTLLNRHYPSLNVLVKNDAEFTRVYYYARAALFASNGNGNEQTLQQLYRSSKEPKSQQYHFYRLAHTLVTRYS